MLPGLVKRKALSGVLLVAVCGRFNAATRYDPCFTGLIIDGGSVCKACLKHCARGGGKGSSESRIILRTRAAFTISAYLKHWVLSRHLVLRCFEKRLHTVKHGMGSNNGFILLANGVTDGILCLGCHVPLTLITHTLRLMSSLHKQVPIYILVHSV